MGFNSGFKGLTIPATLPDTTDRNEPCHVTATALQINHRH